MITLLLLLLCFVLVSPYGTTVYEDTHEVAGGAVCVEVELDNRLYEAGDAARVTIDLRMDEHGDRRGVDTGVGIHSFDARFASVPAGDALVRVRLYGDGRTRVDGVKVGRCKN